MQLDHLVVAARTLDEGVAWCEAMLGIVPTAGGEHTSMGTHNRVFSISSDAFPRAYFEIIAVNPLAPSPGRTRWFDLDEPGLQQQLARGPSLIHWAVRCTDVVASVQALRAVGVDRGEVLQAERPTPAGTLRWQITVRADGQRLCAGALPTLIHWGDVHPTTTLPSSGVVLKGASVQGLPPALAAQLPRSVAVVAGAGEPRLRVVLTTPRGDVTLDTSPTGASHVQP